MLSLSKHEGVASASSPPPSPAHSRFAKLRQASHTALTRPLLVSHLRCHLLQLV